MKKWTLIALAVVLMAFIAMSCKKQNQVKGVELTVKFSEEPLSDNLFVDITYVWKTAAAELDYLVEGKKKALFNPTELEVVGEPIQNVKRRFKRPPTDLDFGEGITVFSEGACSACRGTIHSVVYDLEQMKLMGEVRDLFKVVGANAKVPKGLKNTPIVMGTCLSKFRDQGCHVVGCPPNNDHILAAIKKVCKIT